MKDEPIPIDESKSPKERFKAVVSRIMDTPKEEVERRDKEWRSAQRRRKER